jgi:predicted phosphodiesterase
VKIAFIADIHGNLQALTRVIMAIKKESCDQIICLGDVVGYGPRPQQCIDIIRSYNIPCILGNHDEWMGGEYLISGVNEQVRGILRWTRDQLTPSGRDWVKQLPKRMHFDGFDIVHATNAESNTQWPYVIDDKSLLENFINQTCQICFSGHTHIPAIGVYQNEEDMGFIKINEEMELPEKYKCFINPGSVGQPRDRDPRAAYLI